MKKFHITLLLILIVASLVGSLWIMKVAEASITPFAAYEPARDATLQSKSDRKSVKIYDPHCHQPRTLDDADLCAQWAAVEAVRDSNRVARLSLWTTLAEFVALTASIFFTAWAALAAARAALASERAVTNADRASERQLRPYVHIMPGKIERIGHDMMISDGHNPNDRLQITIEVQNCGMTPAHELQLSSARKLLKQPLAENALDFESTRFNEPRRVGPGQNRRSWFQFSSRVKDLVNSGDSIIVIKIFVKYKISPDYNSCEDYDERIVVIDKNAIIRGTGRALKPSDFAKENTTDRKKILRS